MDKSKTEVRFYNFTDARLIKLADAILILTDLDGSQLALRGVTPVRQAGLKALRDAFAETKPDHYYRAVVSIKTEEKDALRGRLTPPMRTLFVAAENIFEVNPEVYYSFGNRGLTRLTDEEMIRNCRPLITAARKNLTLLAGEGITEEFIDNADALIKDLDNAMDALLKAKRSREMATDDRISKGNALYNALLKLCKTGKDIYAETDESKYNDYVIYNTPGSKPAAKELAA